MILALVVARLVYRLVHGAPADEPTITWWQKAASHATHWSLYLLLILVPLVGWLGISLYGAREVFGLVTIPALAAQNAEAYEPVLMLHKYLAYLTVALVAMHVGAAVVLHYLISGRRRARAHAPLGRPAIEVPPVTISPPVIPDERCEPSASSAPSRDLGRQGSTRFTRSRIASPAARLPG